MNVLVLNCGSTSIKYHLIDMARERTLWRGQVQGIGSREATHESGPPRERVRRPAEAPELLAALRLVLDALTRAPAIDAVAHRIGHGGERYRSPARVDQAVKAEIRRLTPLVPLHHPAMLAGIEACERMLPKVPQVAVFDTAFHQSIPEEAAIYGLPYELYRDRGIRKFGFHGNSHEFAADMAARHLETPLRRLNLVTCHLGGGASVCAIQRGQSIDTSLGFSSLAGLIMATRVGDLDPGILPYLVREEGLTLEQIEELMSRKGGLLGLSGVSADMREILAAADAGNPRALLAIKAFCYRVKLYVGAYIAALGGIDALVFTGGIGQNSRGVRARSIQDLERLGIAIDHNRNQRCEVDEENPVYELTARHSRVAVLVVAANEELMIARQCARALDFQGSPERDLLAGHPSPLRVAVSAHHVHLCRKDVERLFGPGHALQRKAPLYQETEFACEETVSLIGPRGRVDNVRILGPERTRTQIEISRTEEFKLGIDAPIRLSGDLDGTPGITLEGPQGRVDLPEGLICAMRHIHMSPEDAQSYGVAHGDTVMVRIESARELIFGGVVVRVKPGYKLEMHIDTDEANAAELPAVSKGRLIMIQSKR